MAQYSKKKAVSLCVPRSEPATSSSSDGRTTMTDASSSSDPMVRLLEAMAREWPSFVEGLARLGDAISDRAAQGGNAKHMRDLQAFDTLGQLAHAHGALLAHV